MNDLIVSLVYDENFLMCACKIIGYIFALESLAYLVAVVMGVAKKCLD